MEPVVANLEEEYGERVDFKAYNTMEEEAKADAYGVTAVPTFVFITVDGKVNAKVVGQQILEFMCTKIDALLE